MKNRSGTSGINLKVKGLFSSITSSKDKEKRKLKVPGFDPMSPALAYPLFIIAFMVMGLKGLDFFSALLFILFMASFLAGCRFLRAGEKMKNPMIWKMGLPLFILGAAAEFLNILYVGALPVIVPSIRTRLIPSLSYISFLIVPGSIIKITDSLLKRRKGESAFWLLSGLLLISLTGYRTEIFALLLGAFISAYYISAHSASPLRAFKYGAIFLSLLLVITLFVSYFRDTPLQAMTERFSFTACVFTSMVDNLGLSLLGSTGGVVHKSILSSVMIVPGPKTGPRTFISQLVGITTGSTTPTIIGLPYLDFGITGVILCGLLLGLLFGSGYKMLRRGDTDILPVHALCMAFLLITIETGIADAIVLAYLLWYLLLVV